MNATEHIFTQAAMVSPNRETYRVRTRTAKPSVVVVPTCNTSKDNRFTRGERHAAHVGMACGGYGRTFAHCSSSRTVAWNPASKVSNAWNTARGGACEQRRENNSGGGESRISTETSTTLTATSSRTVQGIKVRNCGRLQLPTPSFLDFNDFGAGAPDSLMKTERAQKRDVVLLTIETEGRVSGGDRATTSIVATSRDRTNSPSFNRCATAMAARAANGKTAFEVAS